MPCHHEAKAKESKKDKGREECECLNGGKKLEGRKLRGKKLSGKK